jgi:hypothetical protein
MEIISTIFVHSGALMDEADHDIDVVPCARWHWRGLLAPCGMNPETAILLNAQ